MKKIAAAVLTLNEENNISQCIKSIKKHFDQIYIVDSGSEDNTVEIAKSLNVNILENIQRGRFDASEQRNWLLKKLENTHEWVFFIDADEMISEKFIMNYSNIILEDSFDVISIPLLYFYHDQKIKSFGFPNWHDRIIRTNQKFISAVGEHINTKKKLFAKNLVLNHYFNSDGYVKFWEKQLRYSSFIGEQLYKYRNNQYSEYFNKLSGNSGLKKFAAKLFWLRPFLRFFYNYIYKRGFLEGKAGFIMSVNLFFFEYLILLSCIEYERKKQGKKL